MFRVVTRGDAAVELAVLETAAALLLASSSPRQRTWGCIVKFIRG